jgi:enoyl-CoA hydratase/carnithine racemase
VSSLEVVRLRRTSDTTARLTLTRPARRNAINAQLATEFAQAVTTIEEWGVHVAILDAEGPAFCAGVDLSELDTGGASLKSVVESILSSPVHWTAVVQGAARGGALEVLAACPRVLAGTSATFGLPELSKGFFPTDLMRSQIASLGMRRAFGLAFSATPIDAAQALRMGLISDVVADHQLAEHASDLARALATVDAEGLRAGISLWQSVVRDSTLAN